MESRTIESLNKPQRGFASQRRVAHAVGYPGTHPTQKIINPERVVPELKSPPLLLAAKSMLDCISATFFDPFCGWKKCVSFCSRR
jgi:hypothetical protein